jgi:hypothetical protein
MGWLGGDLSIRARNGECERRFETVIADKLLETV